MKTAVTISIGTFLGELIGFILPIALGCWAKELVIFTTVAFGIIAGGDVAIYRAAGKKAAIIVGIGALLGAIAGLILSLISGYELDKGAVIFAASAFAIVGGGTATIAEMSMMPGPRTAETDKINRSIAALVGGTCGLVTGAGLEALFRKTAYDINAIVITKTGSTSLVLKASIELQKQYEMEAEKGGLHGFLAWKLLDYAHHGGGLAYGEMAQADIVVIVYAAIIGAIIGMLAVSKRGWAALLALGLAAWGISAGGYPIYTLGNVLGRAVVLIGGALGGSVPLILLQALDWWRDR